MLWHRAEEMTAAMTSVAEAEGVGAVARERRVSLVSWGRYVFRLVVLVGLYYGSAKLGYVLKFSGPVAAIVWLPVGVAVAGLSLYGLELLPGVLVGDLLANQYTTVPLGAAIGQTAGNMLEVVVAALLIRRLLRRGSPLGSIGGVGQLLGALAFATLISATVGPVSLALADVVSTDSLVKVARTWWLGDFCGALVVVPLALAWLPFPRRFLSRRAAFEGALLIAIAASLGELASHTHDPLTYLTFPALIWAAVRFGERGATLVVAVIAAIVIWGTTHYEGPFVFQSITHSVVSTQLFIAVAAVSSLCLAALVAEREAFAGRLGETRAQLFRAATTERNRIERDLHDGAQQHLLALAVRMHLSAERADESDGWYSGAFADAEHDLHVAIDELRDLTHGMHPSVLTELGLADTIRTIAARSSIPVTILELPASRSDDRSEATAYFVVMEGMANAMRHSGAAAISVRVHLAANALRVEVADDGIGGAVEQAGSGLAGLRARVEKTGGTFTLSSISGVGTRIAAVIPTAA
jgi:signal transduction histidine kinase